MELLSFFLPVSLFTFIVFIFLSKNPVYGVLSFIVVVMHVVILLLLLDLEFLAYALAIVYIGAIVVLFLFVIMMFYIHHFKTQRSFVRGVTEYFLLGWLGSNIAYYMAFFDNTGYTDYPELIYNNHLISMIAWYFFNDAAILTVLVALIMLVGIVGAVILTVKNNPVARAPLIRVRNSVVDILTKQK